MDSRSRTSRVARAQKVLIRHIKWIKYSGAVIRWFSPQAGIGQSRKWEVFVDDIESASKAWCVYVTGVLSDEYQFSEIWKIDCYQQTPSIVVYLTASIVQVGVVQNTGRHTKGQHEGGGEGQEQKNDKKTWNTTMTINFLTTWKVPHKDEKEGKEGGLSKKMVVELKFVF